MKRAEVQPERLVVDSATLSDPGSYEINQDFVVGWMDGDVGIWVVADGLGGHPGSESASRVAVDACLDEFIAHPGAGRGTLEALVDAAHAAVRSAQNASAGLSAIRTTLAVLVKAGPDVAWAHVGDTRVYRFAAGTPPRHTRDHSVPQMMAAMGEIEDSEIRGHPQRNRITRALGQEGDLTPTVAVDQPPLAAADAFLLCTDGWWEHVLEEEMVVDLREATGAFDWLSRMRARIQARVGPVHDNCSAAGVVVGGRAT